ncbi:MAG: cupin domain-containing protein [Nanoarchaeota archaeon]
MKILIKKPSEKELKSLNVKSWPTWEKEPSTFDWHYDEQETCFILEGEAVVKSAEGEVKFGKGDFVIFPQGMDCTWMIKKKIRKHYKFG